jgi:hypothetical protein
MQHLEGEVEQLRAEKHKAPVVGAPAERKTLRHLESLETRLDRMEMGLATIGTMLARVVREHDRLSLGAPLDPTPLPAKSYEAEFSKGALSDADWKLLGGVPGQKPGR